MAKEIKKSAREASNTFHNIMQASVKGNPKPKRAAQPKAVPEIIAENDNYRVTRFTIPAHVNAKKILKLTIEEYVNTMTGYTVYKEEDSPFAAIVIEEFKKFDK